MMIQKAKAVALFLKKPGIRKAIQWLPEEKLLSNLGSGLMAAGIGGEKVTTYLNLLEQVRPEGGFKRLLANEEVLNAVLELLDDLDSDTGSGVPKGGDPEKSTHFVSDLDGI